MLPKKGRRLPPWTGALAGRKAYALTIAGLLRKELGESHRAIKQLMRTTDASERTVKHWFSGQHGPNSLYLLRLVMSSPAIGAFVLDLMEGAAANPPTHPIDQPLLSETRRSFVADGTFGGVRADGAWKNVPNNVPNNVPKNVPKNVPEDSRINVSDLTELSERQKWFLTQISDGARVGAKEIALAWRVTVKTARRDIGALQNAQLIEYVGSRRKGLYTLRLK